MKLSELFKNCAYDIEYQTIGNDVNYAFVEDGNDLYIYFQGSSSVTDWVRNFMFRSKPYKDMRVPYKVHRGFLAAWKEVEDVIIAKITETDDSANFKWQQIITIGYSHGGALAAFCHECVWFWRPDLRDTIEGYGFEAPRFYAGWRVRSALRPRWERFHVIRTNQDLVTHCPPWIFAYTHVGSILHIHGDVNLCPNKKIPNCIKSHYPEVVYDALLKHENPEK